MRPPPMRLAALSPLAVWTLSGGPWWRRSNFFVYMGFLVLLVGVTLLKDLLCREGLVGYFPITPPFICTAVCVISMVTGTKQITDSVYLADAAVADCGMLNLAHCGDFVGVRGRNRGAAASDLLLRWAWRHRASGIQSTRVIALELTLAKALQELASVQSGAPPRAAASRDG
jgi:hypothetical protein